jgi:hypothetical protein
LSWGRDEHRFDLVHQIIVQATDQIRLASGTWMCAPDDPQVEKTWAGSLVLGRKNALLLLRQLKDYNKSTQVVNPLVTLSLGKTSSGTGWLLGVEFHENNHGTLFYPYNVDLIFPDVHALLLTDEPQPTAAVRLRTAYLTDLAKLPQEKFNFVKLNFVSPRGHLVAELEGTNNIAWRYALMPACG